jgi:hypothetical protein
MGEMTRRQWMQKGYFRNVVREITLGIRKRIWNKFMHSMYKVPIRALYFVVFATLVISIVMNIASFFDLSSLAERFPKNVDWIPKKPFENLPAMAISSAALIALFAYSRGKKQSRSEFFFEQASQGLDEVYDLLKDQNNDRIIWVRAARSLIQAQNISKEIELEEYQRAYRLHEHRVRNDLYLALTIVDPQTGNRNSLPPHFFFGLHDWKEDAEAKKSLKEVAIKASGPIEAYRVTIDEVPPDLPLYPLSEKSVIAVFDFLDYPEEFVETLRDVKDWEINWSDVHGSKAGPARYIHHRNTKLAINGKMFDRKTDKEE